MRNTQKGITFIGWLVLLIPVAIVGYAAIRLTPVYLNYMKVAKALDRIAGENAGEQQINVTAVRNALDKQFDIDAINYPPTSAIVVHKEGNEWVLLADYEDMVPMFAGISLVVKFDKRAVVP
ncbi:MAG: DUF4845 domain-containing protein [Steroidobacteraceae bacterium]